ncbi:MAG: VanW family protein [Flavobacteriales bacterium]
MALKQLSSESKALIMHYKQIFYDVFKVNTTFAKPNTESILFKHSIDLTQTLGNSSSKMDKVLNMKKAIETLSEIIIYPNQTFSFWKHLKQPTLKNGYTQGRTIENGILTKTIGGGLCQLGGILYHLSLIGGLEIVERHNHSIDLYTEENRYTPLGSDAAVSFGYKDLRVKNNQNFPIQFQFQLSDTELKVKLLSEKPIETHQIEFNRTENSHSKTVKTFRNGVFINTSVYKNLK